MTLENCSWNAIDVLNVVDGAELVTIVRDIYLCVWYLTTPLLGVIVEVQSDSTTQEEN